MLTKAPKGTKDILPADIHKWHFVEDAFRDVCIRYGYKEVRTPVFEHTELFARGVGDTTDIVEKQMYTFSDMGNRSITLKPEGTSGVCRAFLEHNIFANVQPTKFYYNIPCFRYERPQSGRLREFHQLGIEVFGSYDMLADAEVIALAEDFLKGLGIKSLELRINSIGCPTCRASYRKALQTYFKPYFNNLCETCQNRFDRNPMRIIDCKNEECKQISKDAPLMINHLCDECKKDFEDLKQNLDILGVAYIVDPTIVRGLDYYTKTAFEFVSGQLGAQSTVCGGGRYNNLIEQLGGDSIPGVGFAIGVERLLLTIVAEGNEIEDIEKTDVLVAILDNSNICKSYGLKLVQNLRKNGIKAQIDLLSRNFKGQFKYADRIGAKYVLVVGENEVNSDVLTLKNMTNSEQTSIKACDIIEELKK
ncbi:MAG: histidine--tRNA ligase [Eubacteriales bacterium]